MRFDQLTSTEVKRCMRGCLIRNLSDRGLTYRVFCFQYHLPARNLGLSRTAHGDGGVLSALQILAPMPPTETLGTG